MASAFFANDSLTAVAAAAAALKATGRDDIRVIAQGGDGGTVDIGLACLSGMFERNDDVLYVCYDNEAYMNTGVQRSGATPPAARTATTEAVGERPGNPFGMGKNLPRIAMAHDIPYVATATVAELHDLEAKVKRLEQEKRRAERLLLLTRQMVKPGSVKTAAGRKRRGSTSAGKKSSITSRKTSPTTNEENSIPTKVGEVAR